VADYINKNILCQAYLHFETDEDSAEHRRAYLKYLQSFADQRAKFFLYPDVELESKSKPGTITAYISILGTIKALHAAALVTLLYTGVTGYPKFRAGVVAIYDDVKRLAEVLISEGLFSAKTRRPQIIRLEARTGVIGTLRNIVADADAIKAQNGIRTER